jgi:hypothetical protein
MRVGAVVICALLLSSCSFSTYTRTTGADTIEDLAEEDRYRSVYAEATADVFRAMQPYMPTETSPGVCNVGGTKQDCVEADAAVIESLQGFARAMDGLGTPARYEQAHATLMQAIDADIEGLRLRMRGLIKNDEVSFDASRERIAESMDLFRRAYSEFPSDNRPYPPFVEASLD